MPNKEDVKNFAENLKFALNLNIDTTGDAPIRVAIKSNRVHIYAPERTEDNVFDVVDSVRKAYAGWEWIGITPHCKPSTREHSPIWAEIAAWGEYNAHAARERRENDQRYMELHFIHNIPLAEAWAWGQYVQRETGITLLNADAIQSWIEYAELASAAGYAATSDHPSHVRNLVLAWEAAQREHRIAMDEARSLLVMGKLRPGMTRSQVSAALEQDARQAEITVKFIRGDGEEEVLRDGRFHPIEEEDRAIVEDGVLKPIVGAVDELEPDNSMHVHKPLPPDLEPEEDDFNIAADQLARQMGVSPEFARERLLEVMGTPDPVRTHIRTLDLAQMTHEEAHGALFYLAFLVDEEDRNNV